jgi:hypothetical protein
MTERFYYRRSLGERGGAAGEVIYLVLPTNGERPDAVPVLGAFPPGWRPTGNPGQVLFTREEGPAVVECLVPRSQFRHYARLSEAKAAERHPGISSLRIP